MIISAKPKSPLQFRAFYLNDGVDTSVNERELLLFLHGAFPNQPIEVEYIRNIPEGSGGFKIILSDGVFYLHDNWIAYKNRNLGNLEISPFQQFVRNHHIG